MNEGEMRRMGEKESNIAFDSTNSIRSLLYDIPLAAELYARD